MEQKQIDKVIHSLTVYAMNDIKHNREKPIAAFILGTCLINTLGKYRYNLVGDDIQGFSEFASNYLPMYDTKKLTKSFMVRLLPFYSLQGGGYKIGWGDRDKEENKEEGTIHVDDFIDNIESALNKFVDELRGGSFDMEDVFLSHPIIQDKS